MRGNQRVFWAKVALVTATAPVLIKAFEFGPDPGHTGAPGESTCVECHSGALNSGPGSVSVSFAEGASYTPGVKQHLVVTVADSSQRRFGFQLTSRLANDTAKPGGTFTAGADGFTQVLCSAPPFISQVQAPCPATAPLNYVEHTVKGYQASVSRFEFDWTPPAADSGPITFYVAGNAANGDLTSNGDRIYTKSYTLTPAASTGGGSGGNRPAVSQNGVVNGASFQPVIAAGSWVTVQGSNLASSTRVWRAEEIVNGNLPTQMDGVSVTINGKPAAIYYISPTQLNVQAPSDDALGDVPVVVTNANGPSTTMAAHLERFSPAFFPWNGRYAVATRPDFSWVAKPDLFPGIATTPAKPGEVIVLWGTGFGATTPPMPAGKVVDGLRTLAETPTIRIGGVAAQFVGGALSPGSAGLYQIAVRIPDSVPDGDLTVVAEVGGLRSPDTVFITVQR